MVRSAWAHTCGCKSRRELITTNEVKRNCKRATECGKEAWSINHELMNKNCIEGEAKQGERARKRGALVTKARQRRCGGCVMKVCVPYSGRSRLMPERATVKAGARMSKAMRQMPELSGRAGVANGEAGRDPADDEACGTPHEHQGTGSATSSAVSGTLLEAALTRENLQAAWKRVKANKGAAGVDGLDIEHTQCQLRTK